MEIKYLGVLFTSCGRLGREVQKQVMGATKIPGCLIHMIWHNKLVRQDTKSKICNKGISHTQL